MEFRKKLLRALGAGSLLLLSACSSDSTLTSGSFSCSVSSASLVSSSSNQVYLSLSASGGTANYGVSNVSINGVSGSLVSGSSTFSTTTYPTVQFSSLSASSLQGASGTVTVFDSSSTQQSSSCSFTVQSSSGSSSSLSCTISPSSTTPAVNTIDTFTFNGSGGTAPYTFSSFSPGSYGTVTSALVSTGSYSASAAASYSSSGTSVPTVYITDSVGNTANCSTSIYVQTSSSSSSYPTCSLSHSISGSTVTLSATATDGQTLYFSSISPGADGSVTYSGNPSTLSYSTAGSKSISATAYSASSGLACNGGATLYDSVYISTGSSGTGSLACNAITNPNPSYRGQWVSAYPQVIASGAGSVRLQSMNYQSNSGMTIQFTSATTASLYFPYMGTWPISMLIQDAAGNSATCTTYQTVY